MKKNLKNKNVFYIQQKNIKIQKNFKNITYLKIFCSI